VRGTQEIAIPEILCSGNQPGRRQRVKQKTRKKTLFPLFYSPSSSVEFDVWSLASSSVEPNTSVFVVISNGLIDRWYSSRSDATVNDISNSGIGPSSTFNTGECVFV